MRKLRKLKFPDLFRELKSCQKCSLSESRKNVVVGRGVGNYRNGLLFIGEAPGKTEDVLGEPFVGESGRLLSLMLKEAEIRDYYITNTVLCHPPENRNPMRDEVLRCHENITRIIRYINPKIVCFIGRVAEKYYKGKTGVPEIQITHPAALLRWGGKGTFQYRNMVQRLKQAKEVLYA